MKRIACLIAIFAALLLSGCATLFGGDTGPEAMRIATYNIQELSTAKLLDIDSSGRGRDEQALAAAEVIQRVRPDILVLNEIDIDWQAIENGRINYTKNARRYDAYYLNKGTNAIHYPHIYAAPSNTGLLSGHDLNNDGIIATPENLNDRIHGDDSFGFGVYPGQYAMAVLSMYPLEYDQIRTFQQFLWKDLPNHNMPLDFYLPEEQQIFRLSSKSHWDVPVNVLGKTIHLLVSHPTPPVFDGDEDRNGRRNYDEVRFWIEYINGSQSIYDDRGHHGGLAPGEPFAIVGDLNASHKSDTMINGKYAIDLLLDDERIQDTIEHTTSPGAPFDNPTATAEFLGGTRVDYVLPSSDLDIVGGGVFWPSPTGSPEGARAADLASDHRMVWIDLRIDWEPPILLD